LHGKVSPATAGSILSLDTGHETVEAKTDAKGHFEVVVDVFKRGGGKAMAEKLGVPFLGAVPLDLAVMHGGDEGKPFALQSADTPAKQAFKMIVAKLTASHGP
jgi:MinD-like ATPase involved in chromosome partitioning or flagellar assembly